MFPCEYYEIFKYTYFEEHLQTTGSSALLTINENLLEAPAAVLKLGPSTCLIQMVYFLVPLIDVFRTTSNIYDGTFLQK